MPLTLSFLGFFDDIGKAALKAVEHEVEWFCLPAGAMLFAVIGSLIVAAAIFGPRVWALVIG